MTPITDQSFLAVQAIELAQVVELEACWENLRLVRAANPGAPSTPRDLDTIQKAYERFRSHITAYNKQYRPAHVPEALLNTPVRLGTWCRRMRDLYLLVAQNPAGPCPVHLLAKAYRWADKVAARMGCDSIAPATTPTSIQSAVAGLETLVQWCDGLVQARGGVKFLTAVVFLGFAAVSGRTEDEIRFEELFAP